MGWMSVEIRGCWDPNAWRGPPRAERVPRTDIFDSEVRPFEACAELLWPDHHLNHWGEEFIVPLGAVVLVEFRFGLLSNMPPVVVGVQDGSLIRSWWQLHPCLGLSSGRYLLVSCFALMVCKFSIPTWSLGPLCWIYSAGCCCECAAFLFLAWIWHAPGDQQYPRCAVWKKHCRKSLMAIQSWPRPVVKREDFFLA